MIRLKSKRDSKKLQESYDVTIDIQSGEIIDPAPANV